jgi:hypothetical protein
MLNPRSLNKTASCDVASNICQALLPGSTKVIAILAIYHDLSVGLACRGVGGLLGMATPEADKEKREREFSELMDKQAQAGLH